METRQLEKLAKMILFGVPQNQIAVACGLTDARISQIKDTEEYKKIAEKVAGEQYEEEQLINQGWDGVEALGVNRVIAHLQANPEPDFALKAAMVANRATRRGSYKNNPIAQSVGVRAVINLNQVFVDRLNNDANEVAMRLAENKKDTNFLAPSAVQDLLTLNADTGEKLEHSVERIITNPETENADDGVLESLSNMKIDTL